MWILAFPQLSCQFLAIQVTSQWRKKQHLGERREFVCSSWWGFVAECSILRTNRKDQLGSIPPVGLCCVFCLIQLSVLLPLSVKSKRIWLSLISFCVWFRQIMTVPARDGHERKQTLSKVIFLPCKWPAYSLVQWNWYSDVTVCTCITCIHWCQGTNFTAPSCIVPDMVKQTSSGRSFVWCFRRLKKLDVSLSIFLQIKYVRTIVVLAHIQKDCVQVHGPRHARTHMHRHTNNMAVWHFIFKKVSKLINSSAFSMFYDWTSRNFYKREVKCSSPKLGEIRHKILSPWRFEHSGMAHSAVMIAHCPASVGCPCITHVLSVHPAAWPALYWSTIRLSAETVS